MTRARLTISKSLVIDFDDKPETLGAGWAEQVLESLRADNPEAQIATTDPDTLTGAIISVIDEDVEMAVDDFEIDTADIKVELLDEQGNPK